MNGNATPADNLQFGGAVAALWIGILYIIQANHWLIIPDTVFTISGSAVTILAAHLWDWFTGDNKPKVL